MKELIDYINKEWSTVSQAPFTFILLLVLSITASYLLARWKYESNISTLKERIEGYKDRITSKDEQLNEYRQRLDLIPITQTSFSRLNNIDLKNQTLKVVTNIREFLSDRQEKSNRILSSRTSLNRTNISDEERNRAWQQETNEIIQESFEMKSKYDSSFKVDTILLRDELLSRLPKGNKSERVFHTYEHPINPISMEMVADDLERLAKSLPT